MDSLNVQHAPAWAVITPSYSGDLERCKLLCRSLDAFLTGNWQHYIVVDRPDYHLFKAMAGSRREILLTDEVVPAGMRHLFNLPFSKGRSLWWSKATGLMIGWHLQQLVKISMANVVKQDGLIFCDSDVFMVRPFDTSHFYRDGRFRLYHSFHGQMLKDVPNPQYTRSALDILGVPVGPGPYYDYVDNFVTWHRQTVLDMCAHIENRTGRAWHAALGRRLQLSEYALYGQFVDTLQQTNPVIYGDGHTVCHTYWQRKALTGEELRAFAASLNPGEVALGIQSFAGVDMRLLTDIYEEALAQYGAAQVAKV